MTDKPISHTERLLRQPGCRLADGADVSKILDALARIAPEMKVEIATADFGDEGRMVLVTFVSYAAIVFTPPQARHLADRVPAASSDGMRQLKQALVTAANACDGVAGSG